MWERRSEDPDFCHIRVGLGDQGLSTALVTPELGSVDELDPVTVTAMNRIVHPRSVVASLPIAVPLRAFPVVTIDGEPEVARGLLRAMVCQLAVLHGPDARRDRRCGRPGHVRGVGLAEMAPASPTFTAKSTRSDRPDGCTPTSARPQARCRLTAANRAVSW